jgi:type III secretory pathway component EscV
MRMSSQEEIAEELITNLSADVLEIQLPQDLLRTFTTSYAPYAHKHLRNARQTMMETLGLSLPEMRFVLNEDLKPGNFACKINNLLMLPWPVVPDDALDYIEPLLMQNVHENRGCFVHRRVVEQLLAQYKQAPSLAFRLLSSWLSIYRITRVLRILITEEAAIRNLPLIIGRLLNYRYTVANPTLPITFEELFPVASQEEYPQLDDSIFLVSFVRIGLKRAISYQYAGEQRQLSSYLFQDEPAVEQALAAFQDYHVAEQPHPSEKQPVIITSIGTRPEVQKLINAGIHPPTPVLAYQELIPGLHIQLIEEIKAPHQAWHYSDTKRLKR